MTTDETQDTQDHEDAPATLGAGPAPVTSGDDLQTAEHLVNGWVAGHLAGGPLAWNVEAWNTLQAALPALIEAIEAK